MYSNLYIREDLISLKAELTDSVIFYDPIALASKLPIRKFANSDTSESSLVRLGNTLRGYLSNILCASSPVLLAYSQYKSAGYPWTVGCLPSSLVAVLAVRFMEISPPTTTVDNISSFTNIHPDGTSTDSALANIEISLPASLSEKSALNGWRRWLLAYVDPYPQWRTLAFHLGEVAAIGYSNGIIEVIYLSTDDDSRIIIKNSVETDFAPIVGLYFLQDSSHLLVCRFSGAMEIWSLRRKSAGYSALLVFQRLRDSPIFSAVYDPKSSLLVLGGEFIGSGGESLTIFSVKDFSFNECSLHQSLGSSIVNTSGTPIKFRSLMRSISSRQSSNLIDGFVCFSLSPDGSLLSALHCTRAISVWAFPACTLLTTIISDAVAIDSSILSCKPLSPFFNSKITVPLHLSWWGKFSQHPLLAVLKSDGSLSVIDIETLENQLFNVDQNQEDSPIQLAPFTSFATVNVTDSNKTELLLLECTLENLGKDDARNTLCCASTQGSYLGRIATVLGISRKVEVECNLIDEIKTGTASSFMRANIIRIASTSRLELCIHRLRSCRFSDALDLVSNGDMVIGPENVWQYQFLSLFHFPVKPTTFKRLVNLCVQKITRHDKWLLRECLCEIPRVDIPPWDAVDLFHTTRFLLNSVLCRSTNVNTTALFRERIYHLDIISRIYAEECATSLSHKPDTHDHDFTRDVTAWCLEIEVYRQNHPLAIALWYLHSKRYIAFAVLLSHYHAILSSHLISLLSTIPATESPLASLRPIIHFSSEMSDEMPTLSESIESHYQVAFHRLTSLLPADFQWVNTPPTYSNFANWACTRAYELDRLTGIVTNSVELLKVATDIIKSNSYIGNRQSQRTKRRALRQLELHLNEVNQFAAILYRASAGYGFSSTLRRKIDLGDGLVVYLNQVKLIEFHKFTSEQRLELLIRTCISSSSKLKPVNVFAILTNVLLPFITNYEKGPLEPRLKQCLLRVAEFYNLGFEAITILARHWQAGDVALATALKDISFKQCLIDFLIEFTPSSTAGAEAYLHNTQELLSILFQTQNSDEEDNRLQRLSECSNALLEYYTLVSELGYLEPPKGIPVSLGDALTLSTDPSRFMQLVNQWIRSTLIAQSEVHRQMKSLTEEVISRSDNAASSSLQAMKKHIYFYSTAGEESTRSSEIVEDNSPLIAIFQRLCAALTHLLGANTNDEARYNLLVGVLCSGDRYLIDFARSELVKDSERDSVWIKSLQYASGIYFDATPAFGMGEVNEELGALCLSFLPSLDDSPDFKFYGAVKFLSGIERLNGRSSALFSRSTWLKMQSKRKAELFTSALQKLLYLTYMTEVDLMQAGRYFDLSEVEVSRCFLRAVIQAASNKTLPSAAIEKTVTLMLAILSTPEPSAWRELRLWSKAPAEILSFFFPNLEGAVLERFRLTLSRFVITHSVFEASCREYSSITSEFIEICASQKPPSEGAVSSSRATRRIFSVLSSNSSSSHDYSMITNTKPYLPCRFYISPLDLLELENCSTSRSSSSFFASTISTENPDAAVIHEMWINGCLNAQSLDVALSYAYGPPLGLKPRHWTKLLCTRISDRICAGESDCNEMENFRIVVASVSGITPPTDSNALFPSSKILLQSLSRLADKHPRIAQWRSKALVSQLVSDPDKFFHDSDYRRNELMSISRTSHDVSLLLARHMQESRSQLVLSNLSAIVFSDSSIESEEIRRQLRELSPYLKRDVSVEELTAYLYETIDPHVEEIPLCRIYPLLKVFFVIVNDTHLGWTLRGDSLLTHLNLMRTVMYLDSSVYFALLSALHESSAEDVITRVRPFLTNKSTVEGFVTLMQHYESSPKDIGKAKIFAVYASSLLENLNFPVGDCIEFLDSMVEDNGDASLLVNWILENLFGQKALTRPLDLAGSMDLVNSAIKVLISRTGDNEPLNTLNRLKLDLQKRFNWIQEQSKESLLLSESLLQNVVLHRFSDIESVPILFLQATREFTSKSSVEFSTKPFSIILSSFIVFIERIAGLVSGDFDEVILTALSNSLNDFLSVTVLDWVYLDASSRIDLEKSDEIIVNFVRSKSVNQHNLLISYLLSLSSLRQIFGKVILNINPSVEHQRIITQNAFNYVLSHFNLPLNSIDNPIERLLVYLRGTQPLDDPILSLLGEEGLKNASQVQAVAIAIELSVLYLPKHSSENEVKVWQSWLKCFTQHQLLHKFPRQLISRVHMARNPNESYLKALGSLVTDNPNLIEVVQSARLLALSPYDSILSGLSEGVRLDPISSRRFISRGDVLKTGNLKFSILEAILEVTGNPRYNAFLRLVLGEMRTSEHAWLEIVLIGRGLLERNQKIGTMKEVLLKIETFLNIL
nr:neuroblastoma amplified sequence [Hymenolepis microstoma]